MSIDSHLKILDEALINICNLKYKLSQNHISVNEIKKFDHIKQLSRAYNAVLNNNDKDINLKLLLICNNDDVIEDNKLIINKNLEKYLQNVYNLHNYLKNNKEMIVVR